MLVSVAICLGGYLPMLGFYRYLLGKLSCDVRVLFLFAGGGDVGLYRYLLGGLSSDVGFLSLCAWDAIL